MLRLSWNHSSSSHRRHHHGSCGSSRPASKAITASASENAAVELRMQSAEAACWSRRRERHFGKAFEVVPHVCALVRSHARAAKLLALSIGRHRFFSTTIWMGAIGSKIANRDQEETASITMPAGDRHNKVRNICAGSIRHIVGVGGDLTYKRGSGHELIARWAPGRCATPSRTSACNDPDVDGTPSYSVGRF